MRAERVNSECPPRTTRKAKRSRFTRTNSKRFPDGVPRKRDLGVKIPHPFYSMVVVKTNKIVGPAIEKSAAFIADLYSKNNRQTLRLAPDLADTQSLARWRLYGRSDRCPDNRWSPATRRHSLARWEKIEKATWRDSRHWWGGVGQEIDRTISSQTPLNANSSTGFRACA
jgi:hypothetical protein